MPCSPSIGGIDSITRAFHHVPVRSVAPTKEATFEYDKVSQASTEEGQDFQEYSTLLSQGFKQDKSTSYIHKKVALTDEVYAKKDRVKGIFGYHYIYTVAGQIRSTKDLQLDVVSLQEKVYHCLYSFLYV